MSEERLFISIDDLHTHKKVISVNLFWLREFIRKGINYVFVPAEAGIIISMTSSRLVGAFCIIIIAYISYVNV